MSVSHPVRHLAQGKVVVNRLRRIINRVMSLSFTSQYQQEHASSFRSQSENSLSETGELQKVGDVHVDRLPVPIFHVIKVEPSRKLVSWNVIVRIKQTMMNTEKLYSCTILCLD